MVADVILCPTQPLFFVASQNHVRVYNLVKQQLVRKLLGSAGRITCLALHSSGDHVLAGAPRPCTSPPLSVSAVPLPRPDLHQRLPVQMPKAQAPECCTVVGHAEGRGQAWPRDREASTGNDASRAFHSQAGRAGGWRSATCAENHNTIESEKDTNLLLAFCFQVARTGGWRGTTWSCPPSPTRHFGTTRAR